jgi:hypothetical protein
LAPADEADGALAPLGAEAPAFGLTAFALGSDFVFGLAPGLVLVLGLVPGPVVDLEGGLLIGLPVALPAAFASEPELDFAADFPTALAVDFNPAVFDPPFFAVALFRSFVLSDGAALDAAGRFDSDLVRPDLVTPDLAELALPALDFAPAFGALALPALGAAAAAFVPAFVPALAPAALAALAFSATALAAADLTAPVFPIRRPGGGAFFTVPVLRGLTCVAAMTVGLGTGPVVGSMGTESGSAPAPYADAMPAIALDLSQRLSSGPLPWY